MTSKDVKLDMKIAITLLVVIFQIIGSYLFFFIGSSILFGALLPNVALVDTGYGPALAAIIVVAGIGWLASLIQEGPYSGHMGRRLVGTIIGLIFLLKRYN